MEKFQLLTREDIQQRLKSSEDNFVERKKDLKREPFCKTAVAFANSVPENEYAILFIGINDEGHIEGVNDADKIQKNAQKYAEDSCYPSIDCKALVLNENGKDLVAILFGYSKNRPHFAGNAYIRKGSQSFKASKEVFEELIASQNDVTHRILKDKGKIVSVHIPISGDKTDLSRREIEGEIKKCDAHCVELQNVASGQYLTFPLGRVEISYDDKKYRTLLIVSNK